MAITEGEEWAPEEAEAFLKGMVNMELNNMRGGFSHLCVPSALVEKVFDRCRAKHSTLYAGEFMVSWMNGQRDFPELESK